MNRIFQFLLITLIIFGFLSCEKKRTDIEDLKYQFSNGNFRNATKMIEQLRSSGISENQSEEIEIIESKIERIQLDFSKNESQIKDELNPWFPNLTNEQLRRWEEEKTLEMRIIDGERRYFKNAVSNLFRLDSEAKIIKESKEGKIVDKLDAFRLTNISELLDEINKGVNILEEPHKFRIDFTISLKPDAIPAGETVRCWMPFPRESLPRQKNVILKSVNSDNYILADNKNLQRSLYFEKTTLAGIPTVFKYSAEFETAPQYIHIQPNDIKPYDKENENYQKYTAQCKPNIVFSDEIKDLTEKVTSGVSNPFEKVKAIYYWINKNITWASALEYSTFECIPEYVLNTSHGDCGMQTLLFMSMARYAGIPCKWQSGWMLHPGNENLHDWCEVYYEGIGWLPLDQSFGLQESENQQVKDFYITGIDEWRLIINDDIACDFEPKKNFFRSEPFDFQRGELEWNGGNIYFNHWNYHLDVTSIN